MVFIIYDFFKKKLTCCTLTDSRETDVTEDESALDDVYSWL